MDTSDDVGEFDFLEEFNSLKFTLEDMMKTFALFAYTGFDWQAIVKAIRGIEQDQAVRSNDMKTICQYVMSRGTNVKKGTTQQARARIEGIMLKYKIQAKLSASIVRDPQVLTLSRIVACHPHYCAYIMRATEHDGPVANCRLPKCLRFVGAAAIIPHTQEKIFESYVEWAEKLDAIINPGKQNPENVRSYSRLSYNSTQFSQAVRGQIFNALGFQ